MGNKRIDRVSAIVFDFDGTIVRLFENYNLEITMQQMKSSLSEIGLPLENINDVFDVYERIITINNKKSRDKALSIANCVLTEAEEEAVASGIIVDGAIEVLQILSEMRLPIGIVTNNSKECVRTFFELYSNNCLFLPVVGRVEERPDLMKPNIWPLQKISIILGCEIESILFVGDSPRDFECAEKAQCYFCAMTPTLKKESRMLKYCNRKNIVHNFYELMDYLNSEDE